MKKINFKSKGFVTLVACLCLSAGAVGMVALTQNNNRNNTPTTTATEVRAAVTGVKGTTKPVTTTAAPQSTASASTTVPQTTTPSTMEARENNKPYESYFMYPLSEAVAKAYSAGELVYSETMGDYRSHDGIDFDGKEGDTVKAIADGIVLSVTKDELWGTSIQMDHGHNMIVTYSGFKTTALAKGQILTQGDPMGTLGGIPIESADGSHLHLEVQIDGKCVHPMEAMNKVSGDDSKHE